VQNFHIFAPKKKEVQKCFFFKSWFCDVAKVATIDAKIQLNLATNKI
jgi:hypothetical protein